MTSQNSYSPTDETEERAKVILENLLDLHFVKSYLRNRDKVPNVDGELELVNEDRKPIGKFDVQIKSICEDETKFNCPTSLVAYSMNSTSLPVLLICVDPKNKSAYWRHINSEIPEFKENQKTFTVYFSKESDSIDETGRYLQKWKDIVFDYQHRIKKFPPISIEAATKLNLEGIEPNDLVLFQKYIDTINQLFDVDFVSIKKMLFPNMWKIGVGIMPSDKAYVRYQLFISPWGKPKPLICAFDKMGLPNGKWDSNTISEVLTSREFLNDPIKSGTEFVLKEVQEVVEHRAFPVFGKMVASDVLIAFVDKYSNCLGTTPELNKYLIKDLDHALNHHLIQICVGVFGELIKNNSETLLIDLDWLSAHLRSTNVKPVSSDVSTAQFVITSKYFPLKLVIESLRYLISEQVTEIERLFGARDLPLSAETQPIWIWTFHSEKNQIDSVTRILKNSVAEYSEFVRRNHLHFPKSNYLNPDIALVFRYKPGKPHGTFSEGPTLEEYHFKKRQHFLPKVTVVEEEQLPNFVQGGNYYNMKINGADYKLEMTCYSDASDFFQRAPFLDFIYKMLSRDLSEHYNIFIHPRMPL